jgi:hypothetical protein
MHGRDKKHTVLFGKVERKEPLRVHRHRYEDNIKMNLKVIKYEGIDLICDRIGSNSGLL